MLEFTFALDELLEMIDRSASRHQRNEEAMNRKNGCRGQNQAGKQP